MTRRRYTVRGYAVWMALLTAVYYGSSALRAEVWGLIGLSGVIAVLAGIRINRPARTAPWLLLAAALASSAAGQMSFLIRKETQAAIPSPFFADALYLTTYPLYAAALLTFIHLRSPARDRRSLIDTLTVTAGLAMLSWTFLIRPYVHNLGLSGLEKVIAIAYPLGDVLVLALIARLLVPGTGRSRCVQLLTLGVAGGLAAGMASEAAQLHGIFQSGAIVDLGWAVWYAAGGAAALDPSMVELTQPLSRQRTEVSPGRLALLMLASLTAPAMLIFVPAGRAAGDVHVIAGLSVILYLLVLTRLWDVGLSHRRALNRERVLRQAGLSLVTAAGMDQVAVAVQEAAAALLGGDSRGKTVLAVRSNGTLRALSGTRDAPPAAQLGKLAEFWLGLVSGPEPRLIPVGQLPEATRTALPPAGWMLLCPLAFKDNSPAEDMPAGLIAVFGEQRVLAGLSASLEILARQVALTVESIMLRQEVIRQGNEAYFRTLVQDASDAIVIVENDGRVKYATPSTSVILGDIAIRGAYVWDLVAPDDRAGVARTFSELRERAWSGPWSVDQAITRKDGTHVSIEARCSDLRDDPTVGGLVFTIRDVTAQRQLEDELKHHAFHDALTGLPNRVLFQDRISQQLAAARRTGLTSGVLFADLDDFKLVNDTMGHGIGDELLVAAAARLASLVRDSDTAARLGGDEFAVLIGNVAGPAAVDAAAERMVRAFAEPFTLSGGLVTATVSVGVSTSIDSTGTDELLRHADLALYAAKSAGKRQWRHYQPVLGAGVLRRRELQEALEDAVANSAFTLVYQPIVELSTGVLAGFEALVRWPHAQWGMMRPDQFISLAEETGQIVPLGSWVLGRATADLARWRRIPRPDGAAGAPAAADPDGRSATRRRDLYVSVNVSARQFADAGFANSVRQALRSSGLESRALMLELTETALLRRDDRLHADLAELKDVGVRLAIDDFGTGYSSLSYLRELPIDVVKMDKSFVDGIAESPQRLALAEGIVRLARTLQLEVIAEGIETVVQRDLLTGMGCPLGQGYLLAMPLPPASAGELARTGLPDSRLAGVQRR